MALTLVILLCVCTTCTAAEVIACNASVLTLNPTTLASYNSRVFTFENCSSASPLVITVYPSADGVIANFGFLIRNATVATLSFADAPNGVYNISIDMSNVTLSMGSPGYPVIIRSNTTNTTIAITNSQIDESPIMTPIISMFPSSNDASLTLSGVHLTVSGAVLPSQIPALIGSVILVTPKGLSRATWLECTVTVQDIVMRSNVTSPGGIMSARALVVLEFGHTISHCSFILQRVLLSCANPFALVIRSMSLMTNTSVLLEDVVLLPTVAGPRCLCSPYVPAAITTVSSFGNMDVASSIIIRRWTIEFIGAVGLFALQTAGNMSTVNITQVTVGATFWLNMSVILFNLWSVESGSTLQINANNFSINGCRNANDTRIIEIPSDFNNLVPFTDNFVPVMFMIRLVYLTDASMLLTDTRFLAVGTEGFAAFRFPGGGARSSIVIRNITADVNVLFVGYFMSFNGILSEYVVHLSQMVFRACSNANVTMLDLSGTQLADSTNFTMEYWEGNITNYPFYRRWTMLENNFIKHQSVTNHSSVVYRHGTFDAHYSNSSGTWSFLTTALSWTNNASLIVDNISRVSIRCHSQNVVVGFIHPSVLTYSSNVDVSNINASVLNSSNFCVVCVGVHNSSNITVTNVTLYASTNPVGSTFPTFGIVILKPGGVCLVKMSRCRLTFDSSTTGGAVGLITSTSLNFSKILVWDSLLTVTQEAGTVSILSCGVSYSSELSVSTSSIVSTHPLTAVVVATTYLIAMHVSVTSVFLNAFPTSSLGVVSYQQLMVNSVITIREVSTVSGATCWAPTLIGKQAISTAVAQQLFPSDDNNVVPSLYVDFRGAANMSIIVTGVVWNVACTPVLGIAGDCVLLALHESIMNASIYIANTTVMFTSPNVVLNSMTVGVVLLAAAPQISVGDLAQPISTNDVQFTNVNIVVMNVSLTASSLPTTSQRVLGITLDAVVPSSTSGAVVAPAPSVDIHIQGLTITAPRNITLVNIGIVMNSASRVVLQNVFAVFSAAASGALSSSSTFRCLTFSPLYPTDSPNCTTARNADVVLEAVGLTVSRAACVSALSATCDHVLVDMSPVTITYTSLLGLTTIYNSRKSWDSFNLTIKPWGLRFLNSLNSVSDGTELLNVLRLVGNSANATGTTSIVVAPPLASSSTSPLVDCSETFVRLGTVSWQDSASLVVDGGDPSSSAMSLSSGAWSAARPLVVVDLDGSIAMGRPGAATMPLIGVTNVVATVDASATSTSVATMSLIGISVSRSTSTARSVGDGSGVAVALSNVTFRLTRGSSGLAVVPQRTTALVTLSGSSIAFGRVVVRDSLLDLGATSVQTPNSADGSSEALLVLQPPSWLGANMSCFPRSSDLSNNNVVLPNNKAVFKLTYTTAVRTGDVNQQWAVPFAASPEDSPFTVQCNTINTISPLVRADPQAVPQNITAVCDTFSKEITVTPTCDTAGGVSITVTPQSVALYTVYRSGGTFTLSWHQSPDARFNIPMMAMTFVKVSWGAVTSVEGRECDGDGGISSPTAASAAGATPPRSTGMGRCKVLVVTVSTGSQQVVLSNTYVVDLFVSSSFLDCPTGGFVTVPLQYPRVDLPTPQAARDAASVAAAESALVGGLIGSSSIGFAVSRTALMFQLSACAFSDSEPMTRYDSPFGISFGGIDGAYLRGAVVGNCLMVALMVVLALLIALVFHVRLRMKANHETALQSLRWLSLQSLSAKTHSPSNLVIPGSWILQSTVGACVTLLWEHFDGVGDIFVALAGLALTIALLIKYYYCIIVRLPGSCRGFKRDIVLPRGRPLGLSDYLHWFMTPNTKWRQLHMAEDPRFKNKYYEVFNQYVPEYRWFFIVETWVCVIMGVLQGLRPETDQGCQNVAYVVLTVSLVLLLYSMYARPYAARFDEFILQINNAFTAMCAILLSIPSESDTLAAAADGIAMTQVYVSTALTFLWLLHHLSGIKAAVGTLPRVRSLRRSGADGVLRRTKRPARRQLGVEEASGGEVNQEENEAAMKPSGNYKQFARMLSELSVEEDALRRQLTVLQQVSRGGEENRGVLRQELLDVLIRMACLHRMRQQISDGLHQHSFV